MGDNVATHEAPEGGRMKKLSYADGVKKNQRTDHRLLLLPLLLLLFFLPNVWATTYLPYWIEPDASGNPSKVWVKVPSIPANGTVTLYLWKEAGHSPDPTQVFIFYEDFEDGVATGSSADGSTWVVEDVDGDGDLELHNTDTSGGGYNWNFQVEINEDVVIYSCLAITNATAGSHIYLYVPNSSAGDPSTGSGYGWGILPTSIHIYKDTGGTVTELVTQSYSTSVNTEYCFDAIIDLPNILWNGLTASDTSFSYPFTLMTWVGYGSWVDTIIVRKYAPQEPTVTVTDKGGYYEITIQNPNSTDLNDFQISFLTSDVNVTSTTESLAISDTPPSGLSVSLSYSPTEQNELALDPENNITEINVTYTATITKNNAVVTYWKWIENNTVIEEGNTDINTATLTRTYNEVGDYNVCFYAEGHDNANNPLSSEDCVQIHIDEYPQNLTADYTPKVVFPDENITITASATDNGTLTYEWNFTNVKDWYAPYSSVKQISTPRGGTVGNDILQIRIKAKKNVKLTNLTLRIYVTSGCTSSTTFTVTLDGNTIATYTSTFGTAGSYTINFDLNNTKLAPNQIVTLQVSRTGCYYPLMYVLTSGTTNQVITENSDIALLYPTNISLSNLDISYTIPEGNTIKLIYGTTGTYTATITATDDVGLSKSTTIQITVFNYPNIVVTPTAPHVDEPTTFEINTNPGLTVISSEWNIPDFNIEQQTTVSVSGRFTAYGTYTIETNTTLSYLNENRTISLTKTVTVKPITLSITLKDEDNPAQDWNTSAVDLTKIEVWDDDTGEFIGSTQNVTSYSLELNKYHTYRVMITIQKSTLTYTRSYFIKGYDMTLTAYLLDPADGLFYTIYVMDLQNNPLQGYKVSVKRYLTDLSAYVPISEAKSNPDGSTTHFLRPTLLYKVLITAPDGSTIEYDWTADPNKRELFIRTNPGGTAHVTFNNPFESISVEANVEDHNTYKTIKVVVTDSQAQLQSFTVTIEKSIFDQNTPLFTTTVVGSPSGGTVEYNVYSSGVYIVKVSVLTNGNNYDFPPITVLVANKPFFSSNLGISDFTYILIATIVTLASAGMVAPFSPGGAVILGLTVFGAFTFFNPTATVAGVSMWHIFLIMAILTLGVALLRAYL